MTCWHDDILMRWVKCHLLLEVTSPASLLVCSVGLDNLKSHMWFPLYFCWTLPVSSVNACSAEIYPNSRKLGWKMHTNGNWTWIWIGEMWLGLLPHRACSCDGLFLIPFWALSRLTDVHMWWGWWQTWGAGGGEEKGLGFETAGKLYLLGSQTP